MRRRLVALLPLTLLYACEKAPSPPNPPPVPKVFATQRDALDKAKAVEGQVLNAADAEKKQIDEETRK
jgi:hypothetical protein